MGLETAWDMWLGVSALVTIGLGDPFFLFGNPTMTARELVAFIFFRTDY